MGSTRRSFTDEYNRDAASLILDGGHTIGEVAKKLGICDTSIRKWVSKIQSQGEPATERPLTESERAELARLRKENGKLELQLKFADYADDLVMPCPGEMVCSRSWFVDSSA